MISFLENYLAARGEIHFRKRCFQGEIVLIAPLTTSKHKKTPANCLKKLPQKVAVQQELAFILS